MAKGKSSAIADPRGAGRVNLSFPTLSGSTLSRPTLSNRAQARCWLNTTRVDNVPLDNVRPDEVENTPA
jgi:hypothetical protein